jgi:hypothetical protein
MGSERQSNVMLAPRCRLEEAEEPAERETFANFLTFEVRGYLVS